MHTSESYQLLHGLLSGWGVSGPMLRLTTTLLLSFLVLLLTWGIYLLFSRVVEKIVLRVAEKTTVKWDDIIFRPRFLKCVWTLMAALFLYGNLDEALCAYPGFLSLMTTLQRIVILVVSTGAIVEFVRSIFMLLADKSNIEEIAEGIRKAEVEGENYEYQPAHSLKGLQQMIIIVIIAIAVILLISILFGKDPLIILSGLSAGAAVIMLVFRDSILGVVAGIQLTVNKMVQPGDWITAPKYGVNGIVQEITLATVKVQNWDKTIVTMPPYSLITDAFQNWQGMKRSGGRRVMRSVNIDLSSVRFCSNEESARWSTEKWADHIDWGRRVPNVTAFRHFLSYFIMTYPTVKTSMTYMTRELQPTNSGLPVEVYFFTSHTDWVPYEALQADVIDYIIAVAPEFGLRIFQSPSDMTIARALEAR